MIGKRVSGKVCSGLLEYVSKPVKGGDTIGESVCEITNEFIATRKFIPVLKGPGYHLNFSCLCGDKYNNSNLSKIAGTYLDKTGFKGFLCIVARHAHNEYDHVHFILRRMVPQGGEMLKGDW